MKHCMRESDHAGEHTWCGIPDCRLKPDCTAKKEPTIEIPVALLVNLRNSDHGTHLGESLVRALFDLESWMEEHGL